MTTEERLNKLEAEVSTQRVHINELYRLLGLGPPDPPRPAVQTTRQAALDAEMKKSWEKIDSWADGSHPWKQDEQAHIEETLAAKEAKEGDHPGQAHDRAALDARLDAIEPMRQQQR